MTIVRFLKRRRITRSTVTVVNIARIAQRQALERANDPDYFPPRPERSQ